MVVVIFEITEVEVDECETRVQFPPPPPKQLFPWKQSPSGNGYRWGSKSCSDGGVLVSITLVDGYRQPGQAEPSEQSGNQANQVNANAFTTSFAAAQVAIANARASSKDAVHNDGSALAVA